MKKYLEILAQGDIPAEKAHEDAKKILIKKGVSFEEVEVAESSEEADFLYNEVKAYAVKKGKISTASIQRNFKVGYSRAARLVDMLEEDGVIGEADGAKPRDVIIKQ